MRLINKKVAILVDNYFEQSELEEPLKALKNAGVQVFVIGAKRKDLQALVHTNHGDKFTADLLLSNAVASDYDALVVPGGAINADSLRLIEKAQSWVTQFIDSNKPAALICHAPWLLVSADIAESKRITAYHTIEDDIKNAGGEWVNMPVVIDGSLITSRGPDDLPKFNKALLQMLSGGPTAINEDKINRGL